MRRARLARARQDELQRVEWLVDTGGTRGTRVVYVTRDSPDSVRAFFDARASRNGEGSYVVRDCGAGVLLALVRDRRDARVVVGDPGTPDETTRIIVEAWPDGHRSRYTETT